MLVSAPLVVHALAVGFEVVDLALNIVAVGTLSVAHLAQVIDHCSAVLPQSAAPLLQARVELLGTLPVEELAHLREMIDSVAEIQNVHTVGVVDICHAVPNPLRAITDEHQPELAQIVAASVHLHPDAREEVIGMLDAQHIRGFAAACLLVYLVELQFRDARHLDVSELAVVSVSVVVIYALVALGRYFPRIDTYHHSADDLIGDLDAAVVPE